MSLWITATNSEVVSAANGEIFLSGRVLCPRFCKELALISTLYSFLIATQKIILGESPTNKIVNFQSLFVPITQRTCYISSVCQDCYQVHEWALSLLRTKCDLCQGHIPGSALRKAFPPISTSRPRLHPWDQHSLYFLLSHCLFSLLSH